MYTYGFSKFQFAIFMENLYSPYIVLKSIKKKKKKKKRFNYTMLNRPYNFLFLFFSSIYQFRTQKILVSSPDGTNESRARL